MCTAKIPRPCSSCWPPFSCWRAVSPVLHAGHFETDGHAYPNDQYTYYRLIENKTATPPISFSSRT